MGRAGNDSGLNLPAGEPIATAIERAILVKAFNADERVGFVAIARRSPRGVLEIVADTDDWEALTVLKAELEDQLDNDLQIRSLDQVRADVLELDELLGGQLLLDRQGVWQELKASEREVREHAAVVSGELSERVWKSLKSLS